MTDKTSAWSGWSAFAAFTLMVLGALNLMQGFVALFYETYYVSAAGDLMVWDFNAWGGILLAFGALQLLTGLALLSRSQMARMIAIALVMLNILAQIAFLSAYPLWATVMVALDIFALYGLTAAWDRSAHGHGHGRAGLEDDATWRAGTGDTRATTRGGGMGATSRHDRL